MGTTLPLLITLLTSSVVSIMTNDRIENFHDSAETSPSDRETCKPGVAGPMMRVNTTDRLRSLRIQMKAYSYNAYIIPSADAHQSEYVAPVDKRREYISGFDGSAGTAVVLEDQAALWTDGRYFLQAEEQLDCNWILMKDKQTSTPSIEKWLSIKLAKNSYVGADPSLISQKQWLKWLDELRQSDIVLVGGNDNLVDEIWSSGRPPEAAEKIYVLDVKYAGKLWQDKVEDLREVLKEKNVDGVIITALDDIAWLFNLRGSDVPFNPVFKAYAFVSQDLISLYVGKIKVTTEVNRHLSSPHLPSRNRVQIKSYNDAFQDMNGIFVTLNKILISSTSSYAVYNLVPESKRVVEEYSPIHLMKSAKNKIEIEGMKNANNKDSVAIIEFLAMLEEEVQAGKYWDEIEASRVLSKLKAKQDLYMGDSFCTISASGPNGAIIHYKPTLETSRKIDTSSLYLLDSGGQYLDGTTDITRTVHFGNPTDFQKVAYTHVLMGAIDLACAIFSEDVRDADLDILARKELYKLGLNYLHGTGHGIGHFLFVHEGPNYVVSATMSRHARIFKPGVFISDEPGYYQDGEFGIRLETALMVTEAKTKYKFNNKSYYGFEAVTLMPFETKLIKLELLSKNQIKWLNEYNRKIRDVIGKELKAQNKEKGLNWMLERTKDIPDCNNNAPKPNSLFRTLILFISPSILFLKL